MRTPRQTLAERFLVEHGYDPDPLGWARIDLGILTGNGTVAMDELHKHFDPGAFLNNAMLRERYIPKFGFAIITEDLVRELKRYQPLVEVGAGCGYWSYELKRGCVDIVATEPCFQRNGTNKQWEKQWTSLESLTADQAVLKYPERNVLSVWPTSFAIDYAKAMRSGRLLIFCGERGELTGSSEFHDYLDDHFDEVAHHVIPRFFPIKDSVWVLKKR